MLPLAGLSGLSSEGFAAGASCLFPCELTGTTAHLLRSASHRCITRREAFCGDPKRAT
jgi:hypothetical protein